MHRYNPAASGPSHCPKTFYKMQERSASIVRFDALAASVQWGAHSPLIIMARVRFSIALTSLKETCSKVTQEKGSVVFTCIWRFECQSQIKAFKCPVVWVGMNASSSTFISQW